MATLVTGGTGFVGSNIVKRLALSGHPVVCLDINEPDRLLQDYWEEAASQVIFLRRDIRNWGEVERVGESEAIDKIVHAAVFTATRSEVETLRSREIVDINVTGTTNMLELARIHKVSRFVYVSSGSVYGTVPSNQPPVAEDRNPEPRTLYAITKYASELLTRRYGEVHGFSTASTRLSSPYGPMERVTGHRDLMSVMYRWTGKVARGEEVPADNLGAGMDFTYVADTAAGVQAVLEAPNLPNDVYNVTAGVWLSLGDVLAELRRLSPTTRTVEGGGGGPGIRSLQPSRPPMSNQRLRQDLGWKPRYDLSSGLAEYLRWRQEANFLD